MRTRGLASIRFPVTVDDSGWSPARDVVGSRPRAHLIPAGATAVHGARLAADAECSGSTVVAPAPASGFARGVEHQGEQHGRGCLAGGHPVSDPSEVPHGDR